MELTCPQCGAAIAEADLDLKAGVANCRACGTMLVLTRRGARLIATPADTVSHSDKPAPQNDRERPSAFTATEQDDVLTITFPAKKLRQGWRLLSVAAFALVFAVVLARDMLVHRPAAFFLFMLGALLIGLTALVMLVAGLYVAFGRSAVTIARDQAVFRRRLFGLTLVERASLRGVTRVQPFRMRQRTHLELFSCGLLIGERRCKFFHDLGDVEMFRLADLVNGFLKRVNAEDFAQALQAEPEPSDATGLSDPTTPPGH